MSRSTTTTQLLDSLHDETNQQVWIDLDARFRPIICGMCMRLGLSAEDAADVAQAAMMDFVRDFRRGKYERGKGRLRVWLKSIARHRAIDLLRLRARERPGAVPVFEPPDDDQTQHAWEQEEERVILHAALEALRRTSLAEAASLRAFELVAVRGLSHEAAAVECGMTDGQVRTIKHRLMTQLREITEQLTNAYQSDE